MITVRIPEQYLGKLFLGTCSWKYPSWKGLFYSDTRRYRAGEYLSDYAQFCSAVEIDQWFWSLFPGTVKMPETSVAREYAESVPDDFIFTVKVPNSITLTNFYTKQKGMPKEYAGKTNEHFLSTDLLNRFLERIKPLHSKLGPLMFQFEYLNKSKMPSLTVYLERLHKFFSNAPKDFTYAIETRNPNYLNSEFFSFLKDHGLGFVYLDGYYMPPPAEVFEKYRPCTADSVIIRLHGDDRSGIEEKTGGVWNNIVEPKIDRLNSASRTAKDYINWGIRVFVNINNHYEGSAPLSIARFLDQLQKNP